MVELRSLQEMEEVSKVQCANSKNSSPPSKNSMRHVVKKGYFLINLSHDNVVWGIPPIWKKFIVEHH